ncbi:MAG: class 1 fructose-bisphosphatase [bacterium]|nr:class 1 fructose-bisphosphatase [bacterium]
MFKNVTTLTEFILEEESKFPQATGNFTLLMTLIENATKIIGSHIKKAGLVDILGQTGGTNVYEEEVQKLDVFSNDLLVNILSSSNLVSTIASEELEKPIRLKNKGHYAIFFDPLDGSSNIDTNVSIGTIFSIYKNSGNYLQKGSQQVAAGYVVYGSSIMFVYTSGSGVNGFTLDPSIGSFLLSHPNIRIPEKGSTYSINEGYFEMFDIKVKNYISSLKKEKKYKLRYVGSMVADIHRTLLKGGIFLHPADFKNAQGKLRLMFEVNPMSFIVNQAGGKSISGTADPLEITPTSVHQRTPIVLGSSQEIDKYLSSIKS